MHNSTNPTAIQIKALSYDYGEMRAINNLSLTVPGGAVFGFLGPNGAGKTTTIHLLLGLLKPTHGQISVLGFDTQTQAHEIRSHTGALLEHTGLYERLSAEDNLNFYARIYRLGSNQRQSRIEELLSQLDLWTRRKELVRTWSRGMKQKLAVARALLHHPKLVFLDEPTAGMDPLAAATLREQLISLSKRENVTVFLNTHNLHEAQSICDLVGILRKGKLIAAGTPDELLGNEDTRQIEIIGNNIDRNIVAILEKTPNVLSVKLVDNRLKLTLNKHSDMVSIINQLASNGVEINEVLNIKTNLEELFLQLMEN